MQLDSAAPKETTRAVAPHSVDDHDTELSAGRAWWGVAVLTLFYVLAFADRQILALLVTPIRRDLGLTLTEFSLLQGLSFVLLYTLLGIPLAWLADAWSRRGLVAGGAAVWSAMTAACGLATNFPQLFLARVGVGIGEAALSPAAYSWIAASFRRERRASAISVYSMGIYLGSGLAFVLGGAVIEFAARAEGTELPILGTLRAWQLPLVLIGLLGIVCVPLASTLREPRRSAAATTRRVPPLRDLLRWMRAHPRAFVGHHVGFALFSLSGYAVNLTTPYFLQHFRGMARGDVSLRYGLVLGVSGAVGVFAGGAWADRLRTRSASDANVRVGKWAAWIAVPFAALFPLVPTAELALLLLIPLSFATAAGFGVAAAGVVELVPTELRGRASAVYLFVINVIGLGLGPTAVAWLAESVFGTEEQLPIALSLVASGACVAAALFLHSGRASHRECVDALRG